MDDNREAFKRCIDKHTYSAVDVNGEMYVPAYLLEQFFNHGRASLSSEQPSECDVCDGEGIIYVPETYEDGSISRTVSPEPCPSCKQPSDVVEALIDPAVVKYADRLPESNADIPRALTAQQAQSGDVGKLVEALKMYMEVGEQCSRGYLNRCRAAGTAALTPFTQNKGD